MTKKEEYGTETKRNQKLCKLLNQLQTTLNWTDSDIYEAAILSDTAMFWVVTLLDGDGIVREQLLLQGDRVINVPRLLRKELATQGLTIHCSRCPVWHTAKDAWAMFREDWVEDTE